MVQYRVYCLDGANRVAAADWIEADDDEAAVALVREQHDGFKCEIWQGQRLVTRIDMRHQD